MLHRARTRAHVRMRTCDDRVCTHMRTISRARALRRTHACAHACARMQDGEFLAGPVSDIRSRFSVGFSFFVFFVLGLGFMIYVSFMFQILFFISTNIKHLVFQPLLYTYPIYHIIM